MIIYPDNPEYAQSLKLASMWVGKLRGDKEKIEDEINRYLPEIEKMETMLILEKISKNKNRLRRSRQ